MKKPSNTELEYGFAQFTGGIRPWPDRNVDWFIISSQGALFPLKYSYGLATKQRPASYTTNQAKSAMRHLGLAYVSLKAQSQIAADFDAEVQAFLKNPKARNKRLSSAPSQPMQYVVSQVVFGRNAAVVAEVLERAEGICETCKKPAPFRRVSNGSPYLEVHHVHKLADGGSDTVENAIAVCPNCHRQAHHG